MRSKSLMTLCTSDVSLRWYWRVLRRHRQLRCQLRNLQEHCGWLSLWTANNHRGRLGPRQLERQLPRGLPILSDFLHRYWWMCREPARLLLQPDLREHRRSFRMPKLGARWARPMPARLQIRSHHGPVHGHQWVCDQSQLQRGESTMRQHIRPVIWNALCCAWVQFLSGLLSTRKYVHNVITIELKRHRTGHFKWRLSSTLIGSYNCVRFLPCGTGYTFSTHLGRCEDDDECALGLHNCESLGPAYFCRNTRGSFRCDRRQCSKGEVLNEQTGHCQPVICQAGYEANEDGICSDIDECKSQTFVCPVDTSCQNTLGSYQVPMIIQN